MHKIVQYLQILKRFYFHVHAWLQRGKFSKASIEPQTVSFPLILRLLQNLLVIVGVIAASQCLLRLGQWNDH